MADTTSPPARPRLALSVPNMGRAVHPGGPGGAGRGVVAEVRRAVGLVAEQRDPDAGAFDVAIGHPGRPTDDELAAYGDAGVTWVMATGWVAELEALAAHPPSA